MRIVLAGFASEMDSKTLDKFATRYTAATGADDAKDRAAARVRAPSRRLQTIRDRLSPAQELSHPP